MFQKLRTVESILTGPNMTLQLFERYIGIDHSGAETPTSSLKGLRVVLRDVRAERS